MITKEAMITMKSAVNAQALERFVVKNNITFGEAIARYDMNGGNFLAVVDENNVLAGVITEWELRKAILKGIPRNENVIMVMNSSPFTLHEKPPDSEMLYLMDTTYHFRIKQVPIVDQLNRLVDIVFRSQISVEKRLENKAVIMAGGEGTRLKPLTDNIPKPLLVIGNRPLLQITIEHLRDSGIKDIYISISYLGDKIQSFFGDGEKFKVSIKYIQESDRLGTAGCLALIEDELESPVIVVNGDVMTNLSFEALLQYHEKETNVVTVAVRKYSFDIPYGVAKINEGLSIEEIQEKPTENYFINSGVYVLNPQILSLIGSVKYCDMPNLINRGIAQGCKVGCFPIREYWIDIGNIADFRTANRDYHKYFMTS